MNQTLLFVYGTLRSGAGEGMARHLAARADLLWEGTLQARLYNLGDHPGAVDSADPVDQVRGEVYRLRDVEPTLAWLDDYEGCEPAGLGETGFMRCRRQISRDGSEFVEAWVYVYFGPVEGRRRLASGDYLSEVDGTGAG